MTGKSPTTKRERDKAESLAASDATWSAPWWDGTVIPTGRYRLKMGETITPDGQYAQATIKLQHLVRPTGHGRGRWLNVPVAPKGASDDE